MNKIAITLTVNGTEHQILADPSLTLTQALRDDLGLTGTKHGCGVGDCGACTVLMNGEPVNSCLVLAVEAEGKPITTIEGLSNGNELHPVQEAFVEKGAVQCGFCTPGMIMSATALLAKNAEPSHDEIRQGLAGNLCRCTGYQKIVEAVSDAAQKMNGR